MGIQQRLQEIERTFGFAYPRSYLSSAEEFSSLVETERFQRIFPGARMLLSAADIAAARESTSATLLPFMCDAQPSQSDIYAFDLASGGAEFRVVVWSDHAVVMEWENFPAFFQWVRSKLTQG